MKHRAMVNLKTLVQAHHGNREESYGRCIQKEDEQGRLGFQFGENSAKGRNQGVHRQSERDISEDSSHEGADHIRVPLLDEEVGETH
ncbi:3-ketoacyl-CoA synthase 12 [Linum grandiflorum]